MLEQLVLQNFQTHHKLTIDLDSHITTIIGESDVGKSSILRALRWLCLNDFRGEAFRRHGAPFVIVRLKVDRHIISRVRGKKNAYVLDGEQFVSFGQGNVPSNVANLLNLGEVNFQNQHDAPFWFAQTGGQVAKELNTIINLNVIDETLAHIASEHRRAKLAVELSEERLGTAKTMWGALEWVVEADQKLVDVEAKKTTLASKASSVASLSFCVQNGREHVQAIQNAAEAKLGAKKAILWGTKTTKLKERADDLRGTIAAMNRLVQMAKVQIPKMNKLTEAKNRVTEIGLKRETIISLTSQIVFAATKRDGNQKKATEAEKELHEQIEGENCPVCGKPM